MGLTSKKLYSLAENFLYRKIDIRLYYFNISSYRELLQHLLNDEKVYTNVQYIGFLSPTFYSYDLSAYDEIVRLLSILVSKACRLKQFTYVHPPCILLTRMSYVVLQQLGSIRRNHQ